MAEPPLPPPSGKPPETDDESLPGGVAEETLGWMNLLKYTSKMHSLIAACNWCLQCGELACLEVRLNQL